MTRQNAIDYIGSRLGVLLADAGITPDTDGLDGVVDDSLLATGWAFSDLATAEVDDSDVVGYRAVLIYVALQAALDSVVNRVSTSKSLSSPSVSKSESRNQIVENLTKRLALAQAAAAPYLSAGAVNSWQAPASLSLGTYGGCRTW